jgi:hypothetical protein
MTRAQAIDLLMLLSALESWAMAQHARLPDYLLGDIQTACDGLKAQVLAGDDAA